MADTAGTRSATGEAPPWLRWFPLDALEEAFATDHPSLPVCRDFLSAAQRRLGAEFEAGADIEALVRGRSWLVDQVLTRCWETMVGDIDAALVAVGGYGRNELLPGSDVDIMLLLAAPEDEHTRGRLESFLMALWDIGLEVGHSVRTLDDCSEQAAADITVATNLMEARLLYGSEPLFRTMRERVGPTRVWPSPDFFAAKLREQQERYRRFDDALYNLEPNVKEGPGGLRDAQMIGWVAKRHFGLDILEDLVERNFLTANEYRQLMDGQRFLWRVRFGLHHLTGRREDRLLFEHQRRLADLFGYHDHEHKLAVEWFMKDYYRTIQNLSRLNEMLLQLFEEAILHPGDPGEPRPINRRFQARKGFLEVTGEHVFRRYPFALLELFLIMQQHPELRGVRATTIRLVRDHLRLIDDGFRADIRCRSLFMEIFRQPHGLTHELRRMNRYGVLAAYYPAFAHIVGQMQYDLFHAYTVDEHTLFVVRNLRRFTVPEFSHEFPLCSRISDTIPKPELLYLAGFFHDIAKGRGGDHAHLGAVEAREFLARHGLSHYDQQLVAWLVENHLRMSNTAQRRDISDPEVINEFARQVGDRTRLDYLYLLTVADIRGTNPTLWNDWKNSLFRDLYVATKRALRRGLENPLHRDELIADIKGAALRQLTGAGIDEQTLRELWADFPEDYFLRHNVSEVVWHARVILEPGHTEGVRVDLRPESERGGSALFIYTPVVEQLFSRTTALINQAGLTITDARIITSRRHYAVNTYLLLDSAGEPIHDEIQAQQLVERLREELQSDRPARTVSRPAPRRARHFRTGTRVLFHHDSGNRRTIVELYTPDSPGLLSSVGQVFHAQGIDLQNAKIATFGTQAEDVFYVTGRDGGPLGEEEQQQLRERLIRTLDEEG
ncbi:MAG TPA: [protein-PII] uridylyltransferase [Gammaproteobacteria bacterium]|nr:[protein-PII] uridylyltransferase [Gammaproteobacteria bacterium]